MRIGILSDSHDKLDRVVTAVDRLVAEGASELIHCGDLCGPEIVAACSLLPLHFVFGNNDIGNETILLEAASENGANCLEWGGEIELAGRRIAVTHGHTRHDIRRLLETPPDYLLTGHSHLVHDRVEDGVRRINPGALHRARQYTVATLDVETGELKMFEID